jgi:hypothetical protein
MGSEETGSKPAIPEAKKYRKRKAGIRKLSRKVSKMTA